MTPKRREELEEIYKDLDHPVRFYTKVIIKIICSILGIAFFIYIFRR